MTTYAENDRDAMTGWPMYAALGAGISLVLTAVGTFWDVSGNDTAAHDGLSDYLPVVGVVAVATVLVFGLVVRTATPASAGTRSLVLGVLSVLTLIVFWSGLPAVLALGAIGCAAVARVSGRVPVTAKAGAGLGMVALGLAVVAALFG